MQCFCLLPLLTRDRTSWPSEGCPPPSLPLSSFAFTGVPPSKSLADLILSWVSASGRDPTHTNPFWHPLMDLASLLCFAYHCVPDPIFFFLLFLLGFCFPTPYLYVPSNSTMPLLFRSVIVCIFSNIPHV